MSTHARKTHAETRPHKAKPPFGAEYMKKATSGIYGMNLQDENAAAAINSEIFGQFAEMAAGKALLKSGNGMSRDMQKIANEIMESHTRHMAKLVEFSNEAMNCHSMMDMTALNAKAMQYFCSDYMNETMKLSSKIFSNDGMAKLCGFGSTSEEICDALGA